jgi:hypothetical protein
MREENLRRAEAVLFPSVPVEEKQRFLTEPKILTTSLALESYRILLGNADGQLTEDELQSLYELLKSASSKQITVESMLQVILAVVIYDFNHTMRWIHLLTGAFGFGTDKDATCSVDFKKACMLGIFQIAAYFDQQKKAPEALNKVMLSVIKDFILLKNGETNHLDTYLDGKLESQVSQFIKGYLKGQPQRLKKVIQLICEVELALKVEEENFSKIGLIIFDQLCYACWASFSRHSRAQALKLLPEKFYREIVVS